MKVLYPILICVLLIGCSSRSEQDFEPSNIEQKNISLEKVANIELKGETTSDIANLLPRFAINSDGSRMAFYDLLYKHFLVTDGQGRLLHIVGGEGRGPEEFLQALYFTFDEHNNLLVYDENQFQLKIFGANGKLKKSMSLFDSGELAVSASEMYARDSLIYFGIAEMKLLNTDQELSSKMVAAFDYQGNRKALYGMYDPYVIEAPFYAGNPIFYLDPINNKIYSTHKNSYRIQIFDFESNQRTQYFGHQSEHYKESEEEIKSSYSRAKIFEMSLNQSFPNGIFATTEYISLYFSNGTEEWFKTKDYQTQEHYLAIYDKDTQNYNAELKLPHTLGTVQGDKFYLIENNNPDNYTIGVYELETTN